MAKNKPQMKVKKNKSEETQPENSALPGAPYPGFKTPASEPENSKSEIGNSKLLWLATCFAVTLVAVFFRFWQLTVKPLHHDEGVNGYFLRTLFNDGVYKYDPTNYHGPTLYFISLAFTRVFGLETFSIRASTAVFGVLIVVLTFFLRKYIGGVGSLVAALMLALSPGMVYISRYFIHEIFFVFCSLGIVLGILFFIEGRRAGIFAAAWMTLVLLICFLPPVMNLPAFVGAEKTTLILVLRISLFALEAVVAFFLMRLLLDWDEGRPVYLMLAAASTALFFASKETAFITIGTMLIACLCIWGWEKINAADFWVKHKFVILIGAHAILLLGALALYRKVAAGFKWFYANVAENSNPEFLFYLIIALAVIGIFAWETFVSKTRKGGETTTELIEPAGLSWQTFRARLGDDRNLMMVIFAVFLVSAYVGALFFSSFFTYAGGIAGAFKAYAVWTKTGTADHTQNGFLAYGKWLLKIESPILILSVLGALVAFVKTRHRFAMFAALWAFGLFAAYTIIPYKTPWLALSFTLPMCIIAGYGINELAASRQSWQKILAALLTLPTVVILSYQSYDLNFRRYDDDKMPYVYAHTRREFLDLVRQIERYAGKSRKGKAVTIEVVSPDYWSLPWYTRDYTNVRYSGQIVAANSSELIIAKKDEQDEDIEREYAAHYKYAGTYPLRPGVDLYLLVRHDLADAATTREIYEINQDADK